jgi:hypothetical protein
MSCEYRLQRRLVILRVKPGERNGTHIYQVLDTPRLQQVNEIFNQPAPMTDGINRRLFHTGNLLKKLVK